VPRHDLDGLSLLAGVLFGGLGLVALLVGAAGLESRWTWPVLLIVAGVVGLLATRHDTRGNP
jgi:fatty acid desaturase